jgi:hypothetical protein
MRCRAPGARRPVAAVLSPRSIRFRETDMKWAHFAPRGFQSARRLLLALGCASALAPGAGGQERAPIRDPQRIVRYYPWSYKELRERQVVMQKLDYSCGAAVLATVARYYWGDNVDENTFLELLPKLTLSEEELKDRVANGLTLTDLRNLANKAGYDATMGRLDFNQLTQAKVPLIVGITINKENPKFKHDHFVVYRGFDGWFVYLADPIRGNTRVTGPMFVDQWQRNAVLVIVKQGAEVKTTNPMAIHSDEVDRGWLNDQAIRRNYLNPFSPSLPPAR